MDGFTQIHAGRRQTGDYQWGVFSRGELAKSGVCAWTGRRQGSTWDDTTARVYAEGKNRVPSLGRARLMIHAAAKRTSAWEGHHFKGRRSRLLRLRHHQNHAMGRTGAFSRIRSGDCTGHGYGRIGSIACVSGGVKAWDKV